LELEEDNISTISHNGEMHLGGEDFDNILLDFCIEIYKKQWSIDLNKDKYIREKIRLRKKCEMIKRELFIKDEGVLEVESLAEKKI
jgi:molecular chaperone DnaK (HSP70)